MVASKQEVEIAKVIEKALKAVNQQTGGREPGRARPSPYPRGRGRGMLLLRKDGPYSQVLSVCAGFAGEKRECNLEYWITEELKYCKSNVKENED